MSDMLPWYPIRNHTIVGKTKYEFIFSAFLRRVFHPFFTVPVLEYTCSPSMSTLKKVGLKLFENFKGLKYLPYGDVGVRWGDMDCMNHVNNVKYNVYFEDARCQWFNAKMFNVNPVGLTCVLSDAYTKFRRPTTWPDTLTIGIAGQVVNKDRGEFKQFYCAYSHEQDTIVAEGWATIVVLNITQDNVATRAPVPENWLE